MPEEIPSECDPGSPRFYCYNSRPDHFGLTGECSFVGTTTGDIYVDMDGADTKCVPTDEGVLFEDDSRASIGPPPNAGNIEDPPPFSLRRSARRLRGTAILFVPAFLLLVIPYIVFRRRQQTR